jgi:hypothetical protein
MYADWTAIGWSMLLGKPPTGAGMEPTVIPGEAAARKEPAKHGASAKQPKKAKPVARKTKARGAAPAKKRRAAARRR